MISGVRASSISTLSASSTIAKIQAAQQWRPRRSARPGQPASSTEQAPPLARFAGQAITQIVEDQILVDAVGHVAAIGLHALRRGLLGDDQADPQREELIHRGKIRGIAARQVVVHRDHMDRRAGERHGHRR
jgi:hypothetical protein